LSLRLVTYAGLGFCMIKLSLAERVKGRAWNGRLRASREKLGAGEGLEPSTSRL
jgi:hypothetical protein